MVRGSLRVQDAPQSFTLVEYTNGTLSDVETQSHALSSANVQRLQYCGASRPFVNDCNKR
jgi:hypothetical protein